MPLSGKSTAARKLAKDLNIPYFSTGTYARHMGMGLEDSIGQLDLSLKFDEQIVQAVDAWCTVKDVVIDGYPRSMIQLRRCLSLDSFKIIFVTANPLLIYDRISLRAKTEGRLEDTPEVVAGRLKRSLEWLKELEVECPEYLIKVNLEHEELKV